MTWVFRLLIGICLWATSIAAVSNSTDDGWTEARQKAIAFVAQLKLAEKIGMITGVQGAAAGGCIGNIGPIKRLGFRGLCLLDGPTAVNRADLISIFPSGITTASSWDKSLMELRGQALAEEFRAKGGHVMLGPVAGPLGRHALGGRNWEGFSPDPYLTGVAMGATIEGIQSVGVQACSKHFIGNEQETQRTNSLMANGTVIQAISSNIDDRTVHELYLWPFANAVKAKTASIMCSYNRVNQTYACENSEILNGLLKTELGFEGWVTSDWFATHSGAKAINAGQDLNMPGEISADSIYTGATYWGKHVVGMILNGTVSVTRLDDMIQRIMTPYYYLGQDSDDFPTVDPTLILTLAIQSGVEFTVPRIAARDVRGNHSAFIRQLGAESAVLLKNSHNTLPLAQPANIGVFGNGAAYPIDGLTLGFDLIEIGALDIGGGSGTGRHVDMISPLEAIKSRAKQYGGRVQSITHNAVLAANDFKSLYPIPQVCLLFLNTFASESWDRTDFEADFNSTLAVELTARRCPRTVVVTFSAGVTTMPWASNPNVSAIIAAHLPGEEIGNSIVDILWGDVNPSGKLPYTIPANAVDGVVPIVNLTEAEVTSPTAWQDNFEEGLMIDYRYFDAKNIDPLFEFGFGLSYTTFNISEQITVIRLVTQLNATPSASSPVQPGGNIELWQPVLNVTTTVSNTGTVAGATVAQLYVSLPADQVPDDTPVQVLRGFQKVFLEPGESVSQTFELLRRDLSYWDVIAQKWVIPAGDATFKVGFSSRDIQATYQYDILAQ